MFTSRITNRRLAYYFWTGWKNSDHGTVTLSFTGIALVSLSFFLTAQFAMMMMTPMMTNASHSRFVLEFTVVVSNGAPQVVLQTSAINTGDCSISLSGGASWLYDLFKSIIVTEIQNGVKDAFNNDIPEVNTKPFLPSLTPHSVHRKGQHYDCSRTFILSRFQIQHRSQLRTH